MLVVTLGIAGHDDDDRILVRFERRLEDLHARDRRHVEIDEHDVERGGA